MAAYIAAPILAGDEAIGAVILCTRDPERKMGELERTLVETAATFLARQMD
ncbi:MAG TPA: stage V sporulation T C-terminal domain-containing protein [Bacillota bacterium]